MGDGAEPGETFRARAGTPRGPLYFVAFWHHTLDTARSADFRRRFARIAGRAPMPSEAVWYDAIMVTARAVRAAGARRDAVRNHLRQLGGARPAYHGLIGPIGFAAPRRGSLVMLRLDGAATAVVRRW
jgi:ABC-type branched-subunit amino acid transport system substrate-binding protein